MNMPPSTVSTSRRVRARRGTTLRACSWLTEPPLRMLMNNLDAEVAERLRLAVTTLRNVLAEPGHLHCLPFAVAPITSIVT